MSEQTIFLAALDKDLAERSAFLHEACASDAALRRGVETLLRLHEEPNAFLNVPAVEQLAASDPRPENAGEDLSFLAPSSEPASLGRLDHYEILEVIGRGGMGVVLRARDTKLERIVAIKVLAAPLAASGTARQRFAREARAAAAIRNEHVIDIHAVRADAPVPYLVMEFIDGCNLEALIRRSGPLEVKEVLRIGLQVARGLAAAHQQGLIHRDVKPANILLENGVQRVKLTDFGLARAANDASLTQTGLIAGTPLYMAPEQAAGEPIDPRADLFSLGSVLYELCTGRPAFRAPTTVAVIRRVCDETPQPIREVNLDIPEPLSQLIGRLHAKKPAHRPASAQGIADELTGLLADISVGQVPNVPADRARWNYAPRGRRLWAAAALVLLALFLGLGEVTGVTNVRGTVIRLFSPEGTLVVEVDDPDVRVTVDGADVVITGAGAKEIRLKPGNYNVEASKHGKVVRQQLVTVTRNGRRLVRITKEAAGHLSDVPAPKARRKRAPQEAWEKSVAALPADKQVEAVARRLKKRNPRFDGRVVPTIRDGVVIGLAFNTNMVSDLAPVRALTRLESLDCSGTANRLGMVSDLSPLRGLPLKKLAFPDNQVSDLAPLRGMPLKVLSFQRNVAVKDLTPLRGMPLERLDCSYTNVADLSPLKGMKLKSLSCGQTLVSKLAPLRGLRLRSLNCGCTQVADLSPLRGMPLTVLICFETPVSDLAPLKGMRLQMLALQAVEGADLAPLRGMPLKGLDLYGARRVSNLRALKGMPLVYLNLSFLPVSDLSVLASLKSLQHLVLEDVPVTDLTPLRGLPVQRLGITGTRVTDLTPLKGLPLYHLVLNYRPEDEKILRSLPGLTEINNKPAANFWKEVSGK
jgi:Leucine-rich repeat (LRR) protein